MMISDIRKGGSRTVVTVTGFSTDRPVSEDLVIGFAMHAARETPSSLFGWHTSREGQGPINEGDVHVSLYTD